MTRKRRLQGRTWTGLETENHAARRKKRTMQADKTGRAKKRIEDSVAESGFLRDSIPTTLASHSRRAS